MGCPYRYLALAAGTSLCVAAGPAGALEFGAFGDIHYTHSSAEGTANGFGLGQFDLYATQQIDPVTSVFAEYVIEDGGDGFVLDFERLIITRKLSDAIHIGAGRYHSPLGYWNRTYHHGALIQDSISRPAFLDFEDGANAILPTHIIGLMADGRVPAGPGELGYEVGYGNASSINTDAGFNPTSDVKPEVGVHSGHDVSDKKAVIGRLIFKPYAWPVHVALFGMRNSYAEAGTAGILAYGSELVSQTVVGLDARYSAHGFDATAEYFDISNQAQTGVGDGRDHSATAYYVQLGYQFAAAWKGFYRYEDVGIEDDDPYFQLLSVSEASHHVVGARWDLDDSNAIKLEANRLDPKATGVDSETVLSLQWAFLMI